MKLNKLDWEIINLLAENAWRSQKDIANKLNRSQQAISIRIAKLKEEGIIKRATIVLDREKAGHIILFSLGCSIKTGFDPVEIAKKMRENPWLDEIWVMTGSHRITARGHVTDINKIENINRQIEKVNGIEKLDFQIATKLIKNRKYLIEG